MYFAERCFGTGARRVAAYSSDFLKHCRIDVPSFAAPAAADKKEKPDPSLKNLPITELSAEEAIQHALNRLAYGPRPGDVDRIKQMGWPSGLTSN